MSTASPRDVIADVLLSWTKSVHALAGSDEILAALTAAGYRVVREGTDANAFANTLAWQRIAQLSEELATALRALAGEAK